MHLIAVCQVFLNLVQRVGVSSDLEAWLKMFSLWLSSEQTLSRGWAGEFGEEPSGGTYSFAFFGFLMFFAFLFGLNFLGEFPGEAQNKLQAEKIE